MPEIDHLTGPSGGFELDVVEREATPRPLLELGIHLRGSGLSLSDTVFVLDSFGVVRCHTTVHNRVRKAALQPADGKSPTHIAVDETVIRLNDDRY